MHTYTATNCLLIFLVSNTLKYTKPLSSACANVYSNTFKPCFPGLLRILVFTLALLVMPYFERFKGFLCYLCI